MIGRVAQGGTDLVRGRGMSPWAWSVSACRRWYRDGGGILVDPELVCRGGI